MSTPDTPEHSPASSSPSSLPEPWGTSHLADAASSQPPGHEPKAEEPDLSFEALLKSPTATGKAARRSAQELVAMQYPGECVPGEAYDLCVKLIAELVKDRDYWKQHALEENAKWLAYEGVDAVLDKFGVAKTFRMDDEDVSLKPYQRIQELGMRAVKAEKQSALAPTTDRSVMEECRAALSQAQRQWRMYANELEHLDDKENQCDFADASHEEAQLWRAGQAALAKLDAMANTK